MLSDDVRGTRTVQYETKEQDRLEALRGYNLLDTAPEPDFDALVRDAAVLFDAPIALISLVDEDRQWFKAVVGLEAVETPRSVSFCAHAIRSGDVYVVEDALCDPVFANNPLVKGDPNIRFYAGAPIETSDGHRLGTICVIDGKPRCTLTASQSQALKEFARKAMALIEARKKIDVQ